MAEPINVIVPGADFQMTPEQTAAWDLTGTILNRWTKQFGQEIAFSIMLSRVSREMRRAIGPEATAYVLTQFAATQQYDQ